MKIRSCNATINYTRTRDIGRLETRYCLHSIIARDCPALAAVLAIFVLCESGNDHAMLFEGLNEHIFHFQSADSTRNALGSRNQKLLAAASTRPDGPSVLGMVAEIRTLGRHGGPVPR